MKTTFLLQIYLCIDGYLIRSPTKYNPPFLSQNNLKQNENNDLTRCNTVHKNAPFRSEY